MGYQTSMVKMNCLHILTRGIRRRQGNSLCRPPRAPITIDHLHTMMTYLDQSSFSKINKTMLRAAVLTAFFGLLRVLEYTCPTKHLAAHNITFSPDNNIMFVRIKGNKTDPFRVGPHHPPCERAISGCRVVTGILSREGMRNESFSYIPVSFFCAAIRKRAADCIVVN